MTQTLFRYDVEEEAGGMISMRAERSRFWKSFFVSTLSFVVIDEIPLEGLDVALEKVDRCASRLQDASIEINCCGSSLLGS